MKALKLYIVITLSELYSNMHCKVLRTLVGLEGCSCGGKI